jgi:putative hydrolase of the HAD superfamily
LNVRAEWEADHKFRSARGAGKTLSMTIKALMIDVDGVIVVHPHPQGWSVHLERDLGLARDVLQDAFFKPHFSEVVHGRAALRERLGPVLRDIAPHLTCDRLIEYWFANDAHLNIDLLQQLGRARRRGLKLHLATVQEHERADFLWRRLGLREQFRCHSLRCRPRLGEAGS